MSSQLTAQLCPACNAPNDPWAKECGACGRDLPLNAEKVLRSAAPPADSPRPPPLLPAVEGPPLRARSKRVGGWVVLGGVVALAGVLAIVASFALHPSTSLHSPPPSLPRPPPPLTIVPQGTAWTLAPQTDQVIPFDLNTTATLSGTFTASVGATAYLLTASEYAQYLANHAVQGYLYSTGNVTQGSLSATAAGGSYHLLFHDASATAYTVVTIRSNFLATYQ